MAGLLADAGQGFSRDVWAGGLGAPVDMATLLANLARAGYGAAGRAAGLLSAGQMPTLAGPQPGGSEWIANQMRQRGLLADNPGSAGDTAGSLLSMVAPAVAGVKAPQIASAMSRGGANLAAPRTMHPQAGMMDLNSLDDLMRGPGRSEVVSPGSLPNDAARRAAGFERGWYRGGETPNAAGNKTGPWYSRVAEEAEDYAKRFNGKADMREYAIPEKGRLRFDKSYDRRLASDVAAQVEGMGEPGKKLAVELRSYNDGERPSGMEIWRGLSKFIGDDGAMEVLGKLGFRAVEGINSPNYIRVFPSTPVRDAARAKFDPARMNEDNIFGRADPMALAVTAGLLGAGAAYRSRAGE